MHPSIATAKMPVATLHGGRPVHVRAARPSGASARGVDPPGGREHRRSAREVERPGPRDGRIDRVRLAPSLLRARLDPQYGFNSPVAYPSSTDPFPHRLAGLAAMIAVGSAGARGRADGRALRHACNGRRRRLQRDLQLASDSLLAFQRDLEARGIADRVLMHVWSEFGRRAAGERLRRNRPRLRAESAS